MIPVHCSNTNAASIKLSEQSVPLNQSPGTKFPPSISVIIISHLPTTHSSESLCSCTQRLAYSSVRMLRCFLWCRVQTSPWDHTITSVGLYRLQHCTTGCPLVGCRLQRGSWYTKTHVIEFLQLLRSVNGLLGLRRLLFAQ